MDTVKVKKESKRKIKVDFERAPLKERLKQKFLSLNFLKKVIFVIFRTVLLVGITYVILFPYLTKIFSSFMSIEDFKDATVILISKNPNIYQYQYILTQNHYLKAFITTFLVSASVALIQTLVCALVAYGLSKFKFKGRTLIFIVVVATLMIPHEAFEFQISSFFRQITMIETTYNPISLVFKALQDWFGIFNADFLNGFFGNMGVGFVNSLVPLYTLSIFGLGFKNGLYIFMLRQFFMGVPDELEESAFVDGSSTLRTFFSIIVPISMPMLVTVFIFAFSWQWTDDFYTGSTFFTSGQSPYTFMGDIATMPPYLTDLIKNESAISTAYRAAVMGTASILIALPLIIAYVFLQRRIVEGVERSGIVG